MYRQVRIDLQKWLDEPFIEPPNKSNKYIQGGYFKKWHVGTTQTFIHVKNFDPKNLFRTGLVQN